MTGRSRRLTLLALALVTIPAVVAAVLLLRRGDGLPRPGSEAYEAVVAAFFEGVAALDADARDNAADALNLAAKLAPQEPASWANLGLLHLRLGEFDAAAIDLEKARTLAPDSGAVEGLLGLLEGNRGNFAAAVAHLRRAVELSPGDDRARYALADELDRQNSPEATAEALRLMGDIAKSRPDNLPALLDRARLAVKAGDQAALKDTAALLRKQATAWPKRAADQLDALEKAAAGPAQRSNSTRVVILRNNLIQSPAFRTGFDALKTPVGTVGAPIERFLRLANPAPTPAPPDLALNFALNRWEKSASPSLGALIATPLKGDGPPTLIGADGYYLYVSMPPDHYLHPPGSPEKPLTFPGGPGRTPSTPDGLLAIDWNSDNALDLALAGAGGIRLLRQEPGGTFADITAATGLGPDVTSAAAVGIWAADVEMDGDLDLVVAFQAGPPRVLRNRGDGTFEATAPFARVAALRGFAWADLDRDGTPDAALLDERGSVHIRINERAGQFRERTVPSNFGPAVALAVADADADGALDLLALKADGTILRLSDRDEGRSWEVAELVPGSRPFGPDARLKVADLDNNGGLDLIVSGPKDTRIWLVDESGKFRPLAAPVALGGITVADFNGDGRLDLAGVWGEYRAATVGMGRGSKAYHWQVVRPRAAKVEGDGRINSLGIGGEIDLRAGLVVQTQPIAGPGVHFGLGNRTRADVLRIVWPNGTNQAEFHTKGDAVVTAEQRLKGSCPFIYAYDGKSVNFVTDFLWRSPLGLRINAQATAGAAQTEDWIKIRGDQLAPRDGIYDIRFTAELWETHYVDHISLLVVDHPAGTEAFVDERFSPRQPPTLAVRPTGPLHPVLRASDDTGANVTDVVRDRDGRYLDTFGRGQYQGVTRDHWVEVEVGDDVPRDAKLLLVAQGWIHPTDSSLNVAIGQGGRIHPKGLSLEVPAADGTWKVARDDLGFPAGKNKTIVVDLDGLFPPAGPRRVRLRTNLEIYWDALAVAIAGDPAVLKTQRIAPETADLRPRGFSLMTQADASSPEVPDYSQITGTTQRWRDLVGFYTRFGDIRELLATVDDRYAILNAGDEIALRFPAPAAPPDGWVRDFVLVGDGWNKDGDYNTAASRTVLPLPSHARPDYGGPAGGLEDDPIFRRFPADWDAFHTRYITPRAFLDGLRPRSTTPRAPGGADHD